MKHAKNITDINDANDFDTVTTTVCVIGSGPAGGILAADLAKSGIDTLLLEAGNESLNCKSDDFIEKINVDGQADINFGLSRQIGGSSNLWAGRTALFEDVDCVERNWIPDSGWPISRKELEPYYKKSKEIVGIPDYDNFENNKKNIPLPISEDLEIKCFQWANNPLNIADYLEENPSSNLRIFINAPVKKLYESDNGKQITHADICNIHNKTIRINAKIFVLAAGGIETPRLLLNSNDRNKNGIGNDNDIVGRYFSTHPKANVAALVLKKSLPTSHALFMNKHIDKGYLRYGLGFSKAAQEKLELLNHYVQLSPLMEHNANRLFEKIKGSKAITSPLIDENKLIKGYLPGLGLMLFQILERLSGIQRSAKKFILRGFFDQYPDKENRIYLGTEEDSFGNKKAIIEWRYTERDRASVISFFDNLDKDMRKNDIGYVEYSKLNDLKEWPLIGIHSHFMGGTRMGSDPKTAVTDKNAKVFGIDNLYIAGPSLFPTYGFANPFYTIVALSLMLTEHLQTKLKM